MKNSNSHSFLIFLFVGRACRHLTDSLFPLHSNIETFPLSLSVCSPISILYIHKTKRVRVSGEIRSFLFLCFNCVSSCEFEFEQVKDKYIEQDAGLGNQIFFITPFFSHFFLILVVLRGFS